MCREKKHLLKLLSLTNKFVSNQNVKKIGKKPNFFQFLILTSFMIGRTKIKKITKTWKKSFILMDKILNYDTK